MMFSKVGKVTSKDRGSKGHIESTVGGKIYTNICLEHPRTWISAQKGLFLVGLVGIKFHNPTGGFRCMYIYIYYMYKLD